MNNIEFNKFDNNINNINSINNFSSWNSNKNQSSSLYNEKNELNQRNSSYTIFGDLTPIQTKQIAIKQNNYSIYNTPSHIWRFKESESGWDQNISRDQTEFFNVSI